jgi:photosystem II stability/assembly factor-like uncharacterized protein
MILPRISILIILLSLVSVGCKARRGTDARQQISVTIDTLFKDSVAIRALVFDENKLWFAGTKGSYGTVDLHTGTIRRRTLPDKDMDFRSIARNGGHIYVLNAGAPATLYRISKSTMDFEPIYQENGDDVFYDSMHFTHDGIGYAMGDPVGGCLSFIRSVDGGTSWTKLPCNSMGTSADGEAGFAASNSGLVLHESDIWIATGGIRARIWHSRDRGQNWVTYDTPIVQGSAMTGIFTADFYNSTIGVIAGGDYEKPLLNSGNKAVTQDGGKSWTLISEADGPGYISSIKFLPGGGGRELVCAGATGIHYSADSGKSWAKISDERKIFTLQCADQSTIYAAGYHKIWRLNLVRK